VQLQYLVTILSLVSLQASVCTQVDSFNAHCSALIAQATCQIWWKSVNNFQS